MGGTFFSEDAGPSSNKGQVSWARKQAGRLANALLARRRLQATPNMTHWTAAFTKLVKEQGEQEVGKLLDWYLDRLANRRDSYRIYSATGFLRSYDVLVSQMKEDPNVFEPTKEDLEMVSRLRRFDLPASDQELAFSIHKSFEEYRNYRTAIAAYELKTREILESLRKSADKEQRHAIRRMQRNLRILHHLHVIGFFADPCNFLTWWYTEVSYAVRKAKAWHHWAFTFNVGSLRFQGLAVSAVKMYTGDSRPWFFMEREILKEMPST